jgi:hypothetical protein
LAAAHDVDGNLLLRQSRRRELGSEMLEVLLAAAAEEVADEDY